MSGTEQLHRQLDAIDDALRAFEDPIVEELAGLRLMKETLSQRRDHIARTIRSNETCAIKLTVHEAAVEDEAAPATLVATLVTAIQEAVSAAVAGDDRASADVTAAVELHVAGVSVEGCDVLLSLTRRPGPVAAQLADPDSGVPVVEQGCARVTDILRAVAGGDVPSGDHSVLEALAPLGHALVGAHVTLTWSFRPHRLEAAEVTLDQAGAQRLAEASAST